MSWFKFSMVYYQIQNLRFRFWLPDPSLILSTTTTIESIQSSSIVNTTKCGTESHGSKFSYIIRGQHQNSWGHQRSHVLRSLPTPPHTLLCNDDFNKLSEPDAKIGRFSAFVLTFKKNLFTQTNHRHWKFILYVEIFIAMRGVTPYSQIDQPVLDSQVPPTPIGTVEAFVWQPLSL